jgi:rhomboid protease GluP
MCPGCRAILAPGEKACPYCGWNVELTEVRREGSFVERALRPLGGVVGLLLAANLVLYALTAVVSARMSSDVAAGQATFLDALFGGLLNPRGTVLVVLGANVPERVLKGEAWRLLCPVFLHGGLIHIAVNMMSLRSIGGTVVEAYGAGKALAVYLLTGLAGSLASVAWFLHTGPLIHGGRAYEVPRVGASGAIFGLVGVLAALGFRIGGPAGKSLWRPMLESAGFILVLGLVLSWSGSVIAFDNAAHVGGFVAGLAAGWLTPYGIRSRGNLVAVKAWDAVAILLALATAASFVPSAMALAGRR